MALRPRGIIVAVALAAAALTFALTVLPFVRFAYRAPELHVGLETAAGVIGALAAHLFLARFLRSGRRSDLALAWALALFAITNLFLAALPAALGEGSRSDYTTWSAIVARLLGASAFAFAAFDSRRLARRGRSVLVAALLAAGALAVVLLVPAVAGPWLPVALEPGVSPEQSGRPLFVGDPVVHAVQVVALALFAAAAVGFTRQADRTGDELLRWIALGAVLAAAARLNYFLFPSLYSEWVYTGDFFRLAFYLAVLVGAVREIAQYWRNATDVAVLEERRRVARDLHDGLAQELAFIAGQTARLQRGPASPEALAYVRAASERALGEARRAIAALTRPLDEPLAVVLAEVAEEVAGREGVRVAVEATGAPELPADVREEVVRIVREAVTNAARHGKARLVRIELANGNGVLLRIADDGVGFDPSAAEATAAGGFGLTSMRERALALGGRLRIESRPGSGTAIEVLLP